MSFYSEEQGPIPPTYEKIERRNQGHYNEKMMDDYRMFNNNRYKILLFSVFN